MKHSIVSKRLQYFSRISALGPCSL